MYKMWRVSNFYALFDFAKQIMDEKDEYIIKTKFGQSFDFVCIDQSELSFENFVKNGKCVNLVTKSRFCLHPSVHILMDISTCSNQSVQCQRRRWF